MPIGTVAYKPHLLARRRLHDVSRVSLLAKYRREGLVQPLPAELLYEGLELQLAPVLQHKDTTRSDHSKLTRQYIVM